MFCALLTLVSCQPQVRKRPFGYVRLGPAKNYLATETYEKDYNLLIRRDKQGLYAMSTKCTHDLSNLLLNRAGGRIVFSSSYSPSTYDQNGKVLTGPAKFDLPYFRLKIEAGKYGGPRNTLYAVIGDEVGPSWRMSLK